MAKICAIVLCVVCTAARAETPAWYTVELIVFEQLDASGLAGELWPARPPAPSLEGAIELTEQPDLPGEPGGAPDAAPALPHAFRLLPSGAHRLTPIRRRLERSAGYRPLLHVAWRQPGFSRKDAPAVHLDSWALQKQPQALVSSGLDPPPDEARVSGTARVYRARYLHLEVDLLYYRPVPAPQAPGDTAPAIADDLAALDLPEASPPTLFQLRESRRMRSRELHYLDHPLFGVLVKITPYEIPQPAAPGDSPPRPGEAGSATGGARAIPLPAPN